MLDKLKNKFYPWLKNSEKYLKLDIIYLMKGAFWLNSATVINSILSLILVYVFGNYLSPETYGNYRYILSAYGIISIISLGGFNSSVARAVAKGYDGDFIRGFKIQTLASLFGSLVSFSIATYYFLNNNSILTFGFLLIGLALPLMEPLNIYSSLLSGKKLFKILAITSIIIQFVTTITLIITILINGSLISILLAYFLSWIILRALFFILINRQYKKNDLKTTNALNLGFNFSAISTLGTISSYLDKIILFQYIGAKEVALYSFTIAPTEQLKGLFKNATTLIMPKFSQRNEKEIKEGMLRKIFIMGFVALSISLIYIILAPFLIKIFLPKYTEITFMSQIYALSLIGVITIPLNTAMSVIPKIKSLYASNILSPITNIILIFILIPLFGLWGAILAKAIGRFLNIIETLLIFYFFEKEKIN